MRVYKVIVKTSDIKGAGTDANVSLQLFGEHAGKKHQSPEIQLDNSKDNFERGRADIFEVQVSNYSAVFFVHSQCYGTLCVQVWPCSCNGLQPACASPSTLANVGPCQQCKAAVAQATHAWFFLTHEHAGRTMSFSIQRLMAVAA